MSLFLYLDEDIAKAATLPGVGSGGSAASTPSIGNDRGVPVGTIRERADGKYKKTGDGQWERVKEPGQATKAPEEESAAPKVSGEEEGSTAPKLDSMVSGKETQGTYSTDAADYPEDSKAVDHYKIAQYHDKTGYGAGSEGHKKIARERTKGFGADEHNQLAAELREAGMQEEATYHEKEASKAERRAKIEEARKAGKDVRQLELEMDTEGWTAEQHEKAAKRHPQDKSGKGDTYKASFHKRMAAKKRKEESGDVDGAVKRGSAEAKKEASSGKEKAKEEKPQPPSSDLDHAKVADHQSKARSMIDNIQSHLDSGDLDEQQTEKLQRILSTLKNHTDTKTVPGKEQTAELKEAMKIAGEHGKKPAEDQADPAAQQEAQRQEPEHKGPNLATAFERGRAAGTAAGKAAASPYAAGALGSQAITYASQGAVHGGHRLLKEDSTARKEQQKADAKNAKSGEVRQSSMQAEKSMSLYLDLHKAVSAPNAGTVTPSEERARIKHESSYAKHPVGVTGGGEALEPDEPDVGRQWRSSDKNSVDSKVEEMLSQESKEEKTTEDSSAKSIAKSLNSEALSMIKSLNTAVRTELKQVLPNSTEMQFMIEELGYDPGRVQKGLMSITGRDRHRFNEWAQRRLEKSVSSLVGRWS